MVLQGGRDRKELHYFDTFPLMPPLLTGNERMNLSLSVGENIHNYMNMLPDIRPNSSVLSRSCGKKWNLNRSTIVTSLHSFSLSNAQITRQAEREVDVERKYLKNALCEDYQSYDDDHQHHHLNIARERQTPVDDEDDNTPTTQQSEHSPSRNGIYTNAADHIEEVSSQGEEEFSLVGEAASFTGEGTVTYLDSQRALTAILAMLPHTQLMVLMRDPVERLISALSRQVEFVFLFFEEVFEEAMPDEVGRQIIVSPKYLSHLVKADDDECLG